MTRPSDHPEFHGLSIAIVSRGARGRDRASLYTVALHRVRAKGSGESGYLGAPQRYQPRSTIASRRWAFPSTSFRSVSPRLAMPSRMRNKANLKSKPNDHRLPRPSGAASLLDAIRTQASYFPSIRLIEEAGSLGSRLAGGKPTRPVSKPLSDLPAAEMDG